MPNKKKKPTCKRHEKEEGRKGGETEREKREKGMGEGGGRE